MATATATTPQGRLRTDAFKRLRRIYREDGGTPDSNFFDWLRSDLRTILDSSPDDQEWLEKVRQIPPDARHVRPGF